MKKLNEKQKRFAEEYLVDLNATQAAIRSGYSEKTAAVIGFENLTKPNIQEYIHELQKELQEKTKIKVEWVVNELVDTYERCRQKVAVLDNLGHETGEWKFEASSSIKCLELLGKHIGMFKDKVELTGKDGKELQTQSNIVVYIPDNGRDGKD